MVTRVPLNFVIRITKSAVSGALLEKAGFHAWPAPNVSGENRPFRQRQQLWYVLCTLLTPVHLVRKTATEVRFKLPIQLRLHQHHPEGIEASAGCCVLAVPFSLGRQALILRRQPAHHVLKLY